MKTNSKTELGLGLAALGRPEYINIRTNKSIDKSEEAFKQNTFSVLNEAYKLGIRYFDTAPSYGKGEAFLEEWNRKHKHLNVVLGTKWGYTYVANWELGFEGKHEVKEHSLKKLNEQWDVSKAMLPSLKYYQVHSATFESGILENIDVLNQLHKIKKETGVQIGITTSGPNQSNVINFASNIIIENKCLFDTFQVTYNVFEQSAYPVLKELLKDGKKVIVKEALANGRVFQNKNFQHYNKAYLVLNQLAEKYKVGVDAIALRFVIDGLQPNYVLSGASDSIQLKENFKALNFKLTEEELNVLKSINVASTTYWDERSDLPWD